MMCNFCNKIFDGEKLWGEKGDKEEEKRFWEYMKNNESKYGGNYLLYWSECNEVDILAETGDSFNEGSVENINFCPYCGEKLEKAVK